MITQAQLNILSKSVSVLVGVIGILVISGWIFNIPIFKTLHPSLASMQFNTALCFVLSALALWLLQIEKLTQNYKYIFIFSVSLVMLISILTALEYVLNFNVGIDDFFMKDSMNAERTYSMGRMAPVACLEFMISATVLFLLFLHPRNYNVPQFLSLILFVISLFSIDGYLLKIDFLSGLPSYTTKMPLYASFEFFIFSTGLLSMQKGKGIDYVFSSNTLMGRFARKIVPLFIVLELLLAWLHSLSNNQGLFSSSFGIGLFGLINLCVILYIILTNVWVLNREEIRKNEMQTALLNAKTEIEDAYDILSITGGLAKVGGWKIDVKEHTLLWTEEVYHIHDVEDDFQPSIEKWMNFYDEDSTPIIQRALKEAIEEAKPFDIELKIITSKGIHKVVRVIGSVKKDQEESVQFIYGAYQDISARKQAEEEHEFEIRDKEALINSTKDLIWSVTPEYKLIAGNSAFIEMVKVFSGKILKRGDLLLSKKIFSPEMIKFWKEIYDSALNGKTYRKEIFTPAVSDLVSFYLELTITPIYVKSNIVGLACFGQDITERKNNEKELVLAKEKAQESDRLKSAFLANMSHEIRTPMNGIIGFAQLLKVPDLKGEKQKEYIEIIEKSGARMLNIINDIIDISKIESGLMKVKLKESNITSQIEYIYSFFKLEAEKKGLNLEVNNLLPDPKVLYITDREKLFAILINLVKNAIKFTNQGSIELGVGEKGNYLEFYVKDTGIGIPKERQTAIFDRFIQADIADSETIQGAGLGLAIAKSYVEILGGSIWVESETDKGSTFYFTLHSHIGSKDEIHVTSMKSSGV